MSASLPFTSSSAFSKSFCTTLYSRYFRTSGSISDSALAAFLYSAWSDWTSAVPSRVISSS
jgi:hypothetical protein